MTTQPTALRLADLLDERPRDLMDFLPAKAAAELRRLNAECNDLAHQLNQNNERNGRIIAQRDALLKALKMVKKTVEENEQGVSGEANYTHPYKVWTEAVRESIAAAEGEKE